MVARPVHWHEGMFLRPHHFQAAQRHSAYVDNLSEKWDLHYNWGLRDIELDLDALENYRLVVRTLRARLRDGTLIAVPEDGALPVIDLKPAFESANPVRIFLAVPLLQVGRANTASNGQVEGARYLLDTQQLEDENTGLNPQGLQVRLLDISALLLSTQDHAGYEVLPIAQVEKSAKAEATPQLDENYIPPLLACDGWKPLAAGILETIYDRVGKLVEQVSSQVVSRGITFDSHTQGDTRIFNLLRVLNEAYALLGTLVFAQGVHPLPAYLELCRLVGQLAIFTREYRAPTDLPRYDHDDLARCFFAVKRYIDAVGHDQRPQYEERPFIGAGLRMQVALEPLWLESINQMFVGVQTSLSADECIRLLTRGGVLDMKIGSSDRVDEIYKRGEQGLKFAHSPRPPRALPAPAGLVYFQVDRQLQQQEWLNVQKELSLAVRINETRVAGNIQGQRVLTIRTPSGQNATMQFTLYIVPQEK